jgi:eukaryotic-like serine/threonine-protein kinase
MALAPGTRLGPYEITGSLGAGGMGEVYRARDTRLDRTVAIKVLPELFATDATFRARFDREARAISALNHPHICTLHDVGVEGRTSYLVMEHVHGQPVQGPLPLPQAIAVAIQICDALEAAHGAGIIHRDLKPSNILIAKTNPPQIKLLDFGLATRVIAAADRSAEETLSALTVPRTIVGTPQYMAPEQIEGREVDVRSDIFALGCVLYELVAGDHAFEGNSPSSVMAAILATEPRPLRERLPITPASLDWIVMRCLAKNPDERWQTVRDLRASLERVLEEAPPSLRRPSSRLPWIAAALAGTIAIGATAASLMLYRRTPPPDTRVFVSDFVAPTTPTGPPALRLSMSPDGRKIAYIAPDANGRLAIWIHALNSLSAQPLAGTLNATAPFWSPDSRVIAFIADGKLKRIDASGGAVTTICTAPGAPPGTWNRNDMILFTSASVIARVPAAGGTPVPVGAAVKSDDAQGVRIQIAPVFLPDDRHFLFTSGVPGAGVREVRLGSIDASQSTVLLSDATSNATYANGYVLYLRETTLMARPFDSVALKFTGDAVPLVEQIQVNPTTGTGAFTVSRNGVLAYQTSVGAGGTTLAWFDRTGRNLGTVGERTGYLDVELSPDGTRASVTRPTDGAALPDIWIYDLARKLPTRLTFGRERTAAAVWSPDGTRVIYAVQRDSGSALLEKSASGPGGAKVLLEEKNKHLHPVSWSPDGRFLLYEIVLQSMRGTLGVLPLTSGGKPYLFLNSGFSEIPASFSPDGQWVAFVSDQSADRKEVFVTGFPQPAGIWQVSTSGGDFPRWSHDGKELFFLGPDKLMAASISTEGGQVKVDDAKSLFDVRWPVGTRSVYDVAPDGRFLMNVWDSGVSLPITIMINWTAKVGNPQS